MTLEYAEESILADVNGEHLRRKMPDGTIFDLTAYDEWNVMVSFHVLPTGEPEMLDFKFYEPA